MTHQATVPQVIANYFGCGTLPPYREHPLIVGVFYDGRGWRAEPGRQRVSTSKIRRLRAEGASAVAVNYQGRVAGLVLRER
jgi:hypothetical protein